MVLLESISKDVTCDGSFLAGRVSFAKVCRGFVPYMFPTRNPAGDFGVEAEGSLSQDLNRRADPSIGHGSVGVSA